MTNPYKMIENLMLIIYVRFTFEILAITRILPQNCTFHFKTYMFTLLKQCVYIAMDMTAFTAYRRTNTGGLG